MKKATLVKGSILIDGHRIEITHARGRYKAHCAKLGLTKSAASLKMAKDAIGKAIRSAGKKKMKPVDSPFRIATIRGVSYSDDLRMDRVIERCEEIAILGYGCVLRWSEDDDAYTVTCDDLPGCVAVGEIPASAISEMESAINLWLDCARRHKDEEPLIPIRADLLISGVLSDERNEELEYKLDKMFTNDVYYFDGDSYSHLPDQFILQVLSLHPPTTVHRNQINAVKDAATPFYLTIEELEAYIAYLEKQA